MGFERHVSTALEHSENIFLFLRFPGDSYSSTIPFFLAATAHEKFRALSYPRR